jgi:hypothetical protein
MFARAFQNYNFHANPCLKYTAFTAFLTPPSIGNFPKSLPHTKKKHGEAVQIIKAA